jgi:hypothetical protein
VVAAVLAAAAGLIAAYLISKYVGHQVHVLPSGLFKAGHTQHWDDQRPIVVSAIMCALGLLLIGYALLPGRFRVVPVDSQDPRSVVAVTRAGLRRYLAGAATTVDGIASAKVKVRRRRVRVYATSQGQTRAALRRIALEPDARRYHFPPGPGGHRRAGERPRRQPAHPARDRRAGRDLDQPQAGPERHADRGSRTSRGRGPDRRSRAPHARRAGKRQSERHYPDPVAAAHPLNPAR